MEEDSRCPFHNCIYASKTPKYINKKNTPIMLAQMILLILCYQEPNLASYTPLLTVWNSPLYWEFRIISINLLTVKRRGTEKNTMSQSEEWSTWHSVHLQTPSQAMWSDFQLDEFYHWNWLVTKGASAVNICI